VNDLIKAVKKKEVRKQGTPSNADRPREEQEFNQLITTLVSLERPTERYMMIPTICKFQFHLNARLDNTCHMKYDFIKPRLSSLLLHYAILDGLKIGMKNEIARIKSRWEPWIHITAYCLL
jgi:hypothetical protein